MRIKFDGFNYMAAKEDSNIWIPFWEQGDASTLFGLMNVGDEISIGDDIVYFQNCGGPKTCSALWPNPDCGRCGGRGVGATINV